MEVELLYHRWLKGTFAKYKDAHERGILGTPMCTWVAKQKEIEVRAEIAPRSAPRQRRDRAARRAKHGGAAGPSGLTLTRRRAASSAAQKMEAYKGYQVVSSINEPFGERGMCRDRW